MKHAIMVMGYGNSDVLQETINLLDDFSIDFIIHWDKKYKLPNLQSNKSKIVFLSNRIKVNWGTDTQILAEKKLMEYVNSSREYDYVHLISCNDIPLMTVNYFKNFFADQKNHIGFIDYHEDRVINNIKEYYPIRHINVRGGLRYFLIIKTIHHINRLFKVNRIKNSSREKGCNWFSMKISEVDKILSFEHFEWFLNTFSGDEFYVQTILKDLKPKNLTNKYNYFSDSYRMKKSSKMACRYIDWIKGNGFPYVFSNNHKDIECLKSLVNTDYAFARKINDPIVPQKIFKSQ